MLVLVHNAWLRFRARIWGKKKQCLLCSVMVFLMCRYFNLYREDMEVVMDTMELYKKARDNIAHTIEVVLVS